MSSELLLNFIAYKLYPALLVALFFGLTIFIHEFGHFLMARRCGMKVERFSIGFSPKMFGWKRNGIEYQVGWIPFGGYVALPQMSPVEALEGKTAAKAEDLPPATPRARILVSLAGPLMNLVLALILATAIYYLGLPTPINPSIVGWVEPGSREEQLGIRVDDRIVEVDGQKVKTWDDMAMAVAFCQGPNVRVMIERNGRRQEYLLETEMNQTYHIKMINLAPQGRPYARAISPDSPAAQAGIQVGDKFLSVEGQAVSTEEQLRKLIGVRTDQPTKVRVLRYGRVVEIVVTPQYYPQEKVGRMGVILGDQIEYQLVRPGPTPAAQFQTTLVQMWKLVRGLVHHKETGVSLKSAAGPIGIIGGFWLQITQGGVLRGVWFAVLLNISLAVFNLLPIPVLDGGHILFAVIEAVFRRPLNARLVQTATMVFLVLLATFMLYVSFFDIQRLGFGRNRFGAAPPGTNEPAPAATPAPAP